MEMGYIKLALINMYDNNHQILIYTYAYYVLSSSIIVIPEDNSGGLKSTPEDL